MIANVRAWNPLAPFEIQLGDQLRARGQLHIGLFRNNEVKWDLRWNA